MKFRLPVSKFRPAKECPLDSSFVLFRGDAPPEADFPPGFWDIEAKEGDWKFARFFFYKVVESEPGPRGGTNADQAEPK
jgi:hypothetical protein